MLAPTLDAKHWLCVSISLLQPTFHGRRGSGDAAAPEWPPSPLRVFQAIVAAAAARWGEQERLVTAAAAFRWLEQLAPPLIAAPVAKPSRPYVLSVPNNAMDVVARAWSRGNVSNGGDASPATHRTMKTIQPMRLLGESDTHTIHYLWPLPEAVARDPYTECHIQTLTAAARCIVALGWGIDAAIGDARAINAVEATSLAASGGERWTPHRVGTPGLRIPVVGTLDALITRHTAFLNRVTADGFCPVPPLRTFGTADYRRNSDLPSRPFAAFILRPVEGDRPFASFRVERAIHVAAMLRHAACEAAKADLDDSPGAWRTSDWSGRFVAGHGPPNDDGSTTPRRKSDESPRFSYLPLPSIGHAHAGGMIRRVLIAEPFGGDGRSASWAAQRLHGVELIDEELRRPVARLESIESDEADFATVFRQYVARSNADARTAWTSITPVILPGYDDGKASKREKLLLECLRHSGIDDAAVESIEARPSAWNPAATVPLRAFRRPHYLKHLPACHVKIEFRTPIRGPLSLGAGRHCGLGIFGIDSP